MTKRIDVHLEADQYNTLLELVAEHSVKNQTAPSLSGYIVKLLDQEMERKKGRKKHGRGNSGE